MSCNTSPWNFTGTLPRAHVQCCWVSSAEPASGDVDPAQHVSERDWPSSQPHEWANGAVTVLPVKVPSVRSEDDDKMWNDTSGVKWMSLSHFDALVHFSLNFHVDFRVFPETVILLVLCPKSSPAEILQGGSPNAAECRLSADTCVRCQ